MREETADAHPEGRGWNRLGRGTDGLPRLGGIGALLSGLLFLVSVLYTFVYLARLGLSPEMLDQPRGLLPWIAINEGAYLGLWWIYLASLLCLLPVVPTLYWCTPATGSAIALVGAFAGLAGVVIGIVGAATNAASASVLGPAYPAADEALRAQLAVLSELFGSLQLYLRLFSDVLVGLWLLATGLAWMERPARWRARGGALLALSATIAVVVASKSVGLLDLEPRTWGCLPPGRTCGSEPSCSGKRTSTHPVRQRNPGNAPAAETRMRGTYRELCFAVGAFVGRDNISPPVPPCS